MQGLALQRNHAAIRAIFAIDLETTQIDALLHARGRLPGGGLALGDLAHPLPARIIYVIGALALMLKTVFVIIIDCLALSHLQLIPKIPLHDLELRHEQRVAMRIIAVLFRDGISVADGSTCQAIAGLASLDQALLGVGV